MRTLEYAWMVQQCFTERNCLHASIRLKTSGHHSYCAASIPTLPVLSFICGHFGQIRIETKKYTYLYRRAVVKIDDREYLCGILCHGYKSQHFITIHLLFLSFRRFSYSRIYNWLYLRISLF